MYGPGSYDEEMGWGFIYDEPKKPSRESNYLDKCGCGKLDNLHFYHVSWYCPECLEKEYAKL
jgi:hypothetical protein